MFSAAFSLLEQFHSNSLKSCTMKKEEKLDGDQHNELEARTFHSARRSDLCLGENCHGARFRVFGRSGRHGSHFLSCFLFCAGAIEPARRQTPRLIPRLMWTPPGSRRPRRIPPTG